MRENIVSNSNGNVNSSRDAVNNNVSRLRLLGNSRRISWNAKRSFRSI